MATGISVTIFVEAANDPQESGRRLARAVQLARRVPAAEAEVRLVPEGGDPDRYYELAQCLNVPANVRWFGPEQGRAFLDHAPEPDVPMQSLRLEFPTIPPCPVCGAARWPDSVRFAARERVEVHYACPHARDTAHYRPAELTVLGRAIVPARGRAEGADGE